MRTEWTRLAIAMGALWIACPANCGTGNKTADEPTSEKNALDLLSLETDHVASSGVRELGGRFGSQDALSEHFQYGHRFLLQGQWYLRTGVDYHRFDFSGAQSPLPSHLQSLAGMVIVEYVIQNYSGAAIELHPGVYHTEGIHGSECFDIPWDAYAGFTIRKDKLYGTLGVAGALFYSVPVIPIVGFVWLIQDNLRVEAVFPRSSLVYTLNERWELDLIWELTGGGFRAGESSAATLSHSVVEYSENRATGQLTYSGWKPFKLTAGAGWVFGRTFDYFRADEKFTTQATPCVKIGVTANF